MPGEYRDDLAAALARAEAAEKKLADKDAQIARQNEAIRALARPIEQGSMMCQGCGHLGPPHVRGVEVAMRRLFYTFMLTFVVAALGPIFALLTLIVIVAGVTAFLYALKQPFRCIQCGSTDLAALTAGADMPALEPPKAEV